MVDEQEVSYKRRKDTCQVEHFVVLPGPSPGKAARSEKLNRKVQAMAKIIVNNNKHVANNRITEKMTSQYEVYA